MTDLLYTAFGCLALGVMTTVHPCPLAANIAAISLVAGQSRKKHRTALVVAFFTLGYVVSLLGTALLVNFSLVSVPRLSIFLQSVLSNFLGPLLILAGMVVAEIIKLGGPFSGWLPKKEFWANRPPAYVFLMGALLALTFCPATAFIFFGSLVPLSIDHEQVVLFPVLYAIGAALPIVSVGALINHGSVAVFRDKWAGKLPRVAGWMLIAVGVYVTWVRLYSDII